jgi:hypothetical protein
MPYDLDLVREQCNEVGLNSELINSDTVAIRLADDITLRFQNNVTTHQLNGPVIDDDALIDLGDDTPWHTHGHEFQFADPRGYYVSMDYLDLIAGIASGKILIAELWTKDKLKERWLIHRDYNNEFDYLEIDDEIRVRRIFPSEQQTA